MDINEYRPLLYFLEECDHIRDVYIDKEFIVEGVGDEIKLIDFSSLVTPEALVLIQDKSLDNFDVTPFDQYPFD